VKSTNTKHSINKHYLGSKRLKTKKPMTTNNNKTSLVRYCDNWNSKEKTPQIQL